MPTTETLDFLNAFYPVPFAELEGLERPPRMAVWSRWPRGSKRATITDWADSPEQAATFAARRQGAMEVHFGVALQDFDAALAQARAGNPNLKPEAVRGRADTAVVIPGLWLDLDVAKPVGKSGRSPKATSLPPSRSAALELLQAVPFEPSCRVLSGTGYHVYWLFHEPWVLTSAAERERAHALVARLQWAVRRLAHERGWSVDATADLARVLRLPGTLNHKHLEPRPVRIDFLDAGRRYDPLDFDVLPEVPRPARRRRSGGRPDPGQDADRGGSDLAVQPADLRPILAGCSFLRESHVRRRDQREDAWWMTLSILIFCATAEADGRQLAHEFSRDHPGYDPQETDDKIDRLAADYGPYSCLKIAYDLGVWQDHCRVCPHLGIRSPISLGRGRRARAYYASLEGSQRPDADASPPLALPPGPVLPGGGAPSSTSRTPGSHLAPQSQGGPGPDPAPEPSAPVSASAGSEGPPPASPKPASGEADAPLASPPSGCPPGGGDAGGGDRHPGARQQIFVSPRENEVADQTLAAIVAREPNLFQRGGALVQVVAGDPAGERPLHRPGEGPSAFAVQEARLRELAATCCDFVRPRNARNPAGPKAQLKSIHPPAWAVRALLERPSWPGVRRLEGVVAGPVLRADGTILQEPGYDSASGLFYAPSEAFEAVPERPTEGEVYEALEALRDAVCDFPFEAEAHFSAWLSSLLTPLARFTFQGPSPLNLIDANIRGAGKSLLADVVHLIVSGRPAARMPYLRDEAELRKSITTIALKARQMVLIDNVSGTFGSPTLDLALTSTIWEDRLLGQNVEVELPLLVTWFATGNNCDLRGDLGRRCVHIRLESPEEQPEYRDGFVHPRLLDWLEGERRRLLPAALTLLVGYCRHSGSAPRLRPWGSYESWSDRVRATVVWLGLPDPALTVEGLETTANAEAWAAEQLVIGLEELLEPLGGSATASEIRRELESARTDGRYGELLAAVEELFPRLKPGEVPSSQQLGVRLRGLRGRNFGGRVLRGKKGRQGVFWEVVRQD